MCQSILDDGGPVYQRLAGLLEEMIENRSLRAGDRMPSVRQFSAQQRVSVPTALQAYVTLETRGLIVARPKSGFYVRARQADLTPEPMKLSAAPKIVAPGKRTRWRHCWGITRIRSWCLLARRCRARNCCRE